METVKKNEEFECLDLIVMPVSLTPELKRRVARRLQNPTFRTQWERKLGRKLGFDDHDLASVANAAVTERFDCIFSSAH